MKIKLEELVKIALLFKELDLAGNKTKSEEELITRLIDTINKTKDETRVGVIYNSFFSFLNNLDKFENPETMDEQTSAMFLEAYNQYQPYVKDKKSNDYVDINNIFELNSQIYYLSSPRLESILYRTSIENNKIFFDKNYYYYDSNDKIIYDNKLNPICKIKFKLFGGYKLINLSNLLNLEIKKDVLYINNCSMCKIVSEITDNDSFGWCRFIPSNDKFFDYLELISVIGIAIIDSINAKISKIEDVSNKFTVTLMKMSHASMTINASKTILK